MLQPFQGALAEGRGGRAPGFAARMQSSDTERLPAGVKLLYGMGGFTMNLPDLLVMQWLLVRYLPPDGRGLAPASLFGLLFLSGRITDGLGAVVIGHWSDNCRSRWGRRLPFMRLGIAPLAVVFFLLFTPPIDHLHWANVVWAFVFIQGYFALYGMVVTPYLALMPEIAPRLRDRVDLTTAQSVFMLAATIAFTFTGVALERWGWTLTAAGAALLFLGAYVPAAFCVRERSGPPRDGVRPGLWVSVRSALGNRAFRYLAGATALYWFGLSATIALVPHWTVRYLGRGEQDVTLLMAPFVGVNVAFFFVFNAMAKRFGKFPAMLATFLGSSVAMGALALVGRGLPGSPFAQTGVVIALLGAPVAGFMVLPYAVLSDVVDYDEQRTGRRREAIFFGVQGVCQKFMIGVSVFAFTVVPLLERVPGHWLPRLGSAPSPFGMKLMALLSGASALAAFCVFLGYPLREKGGEAVLAGPAARAQRKTACRAPGENEDRR